MTRLRCTECPSGAGSDEGECFPRTVPQASAIPGFATARLWNNVLILAQGVWQTFRDSRASRLAGLPEALPLPSRYQPHINLLGAVDKPFSNTF
jgi:hypothetical protein